MPQPPPFGEMLRRHRLAAGLTQEALAERAGLSPTAVGALERGARQSPHAETVRLLAEALALAPAERDPFTAAARRLDGRSAPLATVSRSDDDETETAAGQPAPGQSCVYLSYAHADRETAAILRTDLAARGIAAWSADQDLQPGTASWEQALRAAIRGAPAVLLVTTPHTPGARYVADELRVAELYRRPVYPLWIAGEEWMECVPLGWGGSQRIDARDGHYAGALQQIVALAAEAGVSGAVASDHGATAAAHREENGENQEPAAPPRNPYKGLHAFGASDAADFFGRAALVAELLEALRAYTQPGAARFLAVIGPSGSGKSSVVRAGLLPRLQSGALPGSATWRYLEPFVPGAHPLEALIVTLGKALPQSGLAAIRADLDASPRGLHLLAGRLAPTPDSRVVLVLDQAEEIFTLTADEEERRHIIDLLVTAAAEPRGALLVVLTLRADLYDRPMSYLQLGALVDEQSKAVLPMTPAELRQAIEGPAALPDVGLRFEGDLVGDLLYEVRGQAGALPLLQFTLDQLFERREGRVLTEAAYHALGGVRGALARQAEGTYNALPGDDHRALARALFLRLIAPGATERETTRRRAALAELELADPARTALMRAVAEAFISARLLTATEGEGTTAIEVSHEALIREWPHLAGWLRAARQDVRLQHALSDDAAEWARRGQPIDSLYRGTVLAEALGWTERNTPSNLETAFVQAALAAQAQQAEAERARQVRELEMTRQAAAANRRAATRLRTLAAVLAVGLLAAVGLAALAQHNAATARLAQAQTLTERNVALARQLAAQSGDRLGNQLDLALLLGLEANHRLDSAETRGALLHAVSGDRPFTFLQGHTGTIWTVAFSPTGKVLASASSDGTVRLWDAAHGRPLGHPLGGHMAAVLSVAFSADGTILASAGGDGTVRLWDVARERLLGAPLQPAIYSGSSGAAATVFSLAFSPRGQVLAAGDGSGVITLWDAAHHRLLSALRVQGSVFALAFSPNGKVLASAGSDDLVHLWDLSQGASQASPFSDSELFGHTNLIDGLAFSPDGTTLASASNDGTVRLWNVRTGFQIGSPLNDNAGPQTSVAFSPDGTTLASGSGDGAVQLWDVARRQPLGPPLTGGATADSVAFSPDGTMLAASSDTTILLWNTTHLQPLSAALSGHLDVVSGVAFSPDGRTLYSSGWDATIRRWDTVRGRAAPGLPILADGSITSLAISPNGRTLAADVLGQAYLWDVATRQSAVLSGSGQSGGHVRDLAFSPNGAVLAHGNSSGAVELWDVARRRPLDPWLTGAAGGVRAVAFSPDGRILASGGDDGAVRLWDVARHRQIGAPLWGHTGGVNAVAFSPDGKVLASGSDDSTVRLWDVAHHTLLGSPLRPRIDSIGSLAFSPDGTLLAMAGEQQIQLWDVASRQPLGPPLIGHAQWVTSLAFSPNGKTLASGSEDKSIRLWDLNSADWKRLACRIANRNLTHAEWRQYIGHEPYRKTCPSLP